MDTFNFLLKSLFTFVFDFLLTPLAVGACIIVITIESICNLGDWIAGDSSGIDWSSCRTSAAYLVAYIPAMFLWVLFLTILYLWIF